MPVIIVVLSGFILSAMGTPIFVYRYLIPTLGGVWLLVAIMADRAANRKALLLLILPMLLAGGLNIIGIRAEEGNKLATISHSYDVVSDIPEGSVRVEFYSALRSRWQVLIVLLAAALSLWHRLCATCKSRQYRPRARNISGT